MCMLSGFSYIHRNRTEKKKQNALKSMSAFTYTPKPKAEPKTCTNWILFFIFPFLWWNFSKYDRFIQHNFNYTCTVTYTTNLVIMEAIDGLSSLTEVGLFYKYKTADFCGTKPRPRP